MSVDHVKRLAAKVLGVGVSRIWIDPSKHNELVTVITREEVKKLIKEGVIKVKPKKRNSRYRIKLRQLKRKKGRRR
ncbi:MAG TPA: 50S ribosomal protein L19e, partial [Thermoproteales archaeon]|nr:50S ribosomal protein L19e [Thermoproteales archaeon]